MAEKELTLKYILFLFLVGCGPGIYETLGPNQTSLPYKIAQDYFSIKFTIPIMMVHNETYLDASCRNKNVEGCSLSDEILILETSDPSSLCQRIAHELGHHAAYRLTDGWDTDHAIYKDYFNKYLFDKCN